MTYSDRHRVVFKRYLADPRVLRQLDDGELNSLLEDKNFHDEVACERARRSQMVAPLPPRPAPVVKFAPAHVTDDATDWDTLQAKYGAQPARKSIVFSFAKTIADAVRELRQSLRTMDSTHAERLGRIESELAVLRGQVAEKAAGVAWRGVHVEGREYGEGALTTRSGSLWLCVTSTSTTPGQSDDWRLVVKRGSFDRGGR